MPTFGHPFLAITQKNLANQETISCAEKFKLCYLFADLNFSGVFWRENGMAAKQAQNDLGPQNLSKKLTHWTELLGRQTRNHVL